MSILKVARMGHPILRTKTTPVPKGDIATPPIQRLIDDMIETMLEYHGVGLAAPQVHQTVRVFVAQVLHDGEEDEPAGEPRKPELITMINPEISPVGRHTEEDWEGCLSIPDLRGLVLRHRDIRVRAFDRTGERVEIEATGYLARVLQHEHDHLDGILFLDRMKTLKSLSFLDEYGRYHVKHE